MTNVELENAIRESRDSEASLVFADWLQAQGSPAGEWIALFGVGGLALPDLETLVLETCAMTKARLHDVLSAKLPKLTAIELWFGDSDRDCDVNAADLARLLDGKAFPGITKLGLKNLDFTAELIERLATSTLAPQLVVLDLSMSTLDATTAPLLAEIADRFPALTALDVSDNFLTADDVARVTQAFPQAMVIGSDQVKLTYADEGDRFASVCE